MWRGGFVLGVLVACGGGKAAPDAAPPMREVASFTTSPTRDLDLLLLIDDSGGDYQQNLATGFDAFLTSLSAIDGGLPNLHLGVATSDMGSTGSLDYDHPAPAIGQVGNGGCSGHGKDGALQLTGAPVTDAYVIDEDDGAGGRHRNYTGTLVDVIATMVKVGAGGCGFEQHLAALRRSLTNPANAGFRRATANLAVVIIADEDDCSVHEAGLFGPEDATLGALQSFRCTQFGVQCNEDLSIIGPKTGCAPHEDSQYIDGVQPYVDFLDQLVPDRDQLAVAAIVGPATPFAVELRAAP